MPDDLGMSIQYDELSKTVTVTFRGGKHPVPGRHKTHAEGMKAANDFCRRQGWPHRN